MALALVFIIILAAELFGLRWLTNTEYRLSDIYMRRHAAEVRPDPDIVVIDIDDASMVSMQKIAGLWPWKREKYADLLQALDEFKPRAVVFDLSFTIPDPDFPKSDAQLSKVVKENSNVYLAASRLDPLLDKKLGVPVHGLSKAFGISTPGRNDIQAAFDLPRAVDPVGWRLGLINNIQTGGADTVVRRWLLYQDVGGWRIPSLAKRVAADVGAAIPEGDNFMLRWARSPHIHHSFGDLFKRATEEKYDMTAEQRKAFAAEIQGKIMVVGSSAASTFDQTFTPLDENKFPAVDILALAIDNLKNDQSVRMVSPIWAFAFGALLIMGLAYVFARRINPALTGVSLLVISAGAILIADAALNKNLFLPMATPLTFGWLWFFSAATSGYLRERRSREQAVSLFSRFLNPNVVRQIVEHGETVESLSGRNCQITVLFSDIRGFTTLSETRTPNEVVKLLNRYFDRQVEVVFRHGGTLDKFIGDCIMAFWGAPVEDPQHALHAVEAAMEMQEALLAFKAELAAEGSDVLDFDVGIGVHSGHAVVGFIGAQRKLDYTAIGDTVNLASRVEGLTKGIARLLVTEETMLACKNSEIFSFKPHGAFAVKGRAAKVELFEPIRRTI